MPLILRQRALCKPASVAPVDPTRVATPKALTGGGTQRQS